MSSAAHELRVLDGLHAGARAPLQGDSAVRLAIGSAFDNDVVLSDPGIDARHALLWWDPAGPRWQLLADDAAAPGPGHAPGETLALGPVRVTVAAANDHFERQPGPAEPEPALVDEPVPEPGADAELEADPPPPPHGRRRVWVLGVGLVLALAGLGLWQRQDGVLPGPGGAASVPMARPARPAVAEPSHAAVQAVLQGRGLLPRLRVQGPAGRPQVVGLLAGEAELEALADALLRVSPRPGLQVWTPNTLRAALRDSGARLPAGVLLAVDERGALRASGPVDSEAQAVDLQQRLQALLPAGVPLQLALEPPARLAARVLADAQAQGFRIDGRLQGRQLVMTVDLPEADRGRWERWLSGLPAQLGGVLSVAATLRPAVPATGLAEPSLLAVPTEVAATASPGPGPAWRVRSVVGGASPFVVLADGSRLQPGAQRDGLTLLQIDDDGLLLQRGEQRFKVPR